MRHAIVRAMLVATVAATPLVAQSPMAEGQTLFARGEFALARTRFESVARGAPRDAAARYWWGRALFAEDKPGPAAERFEEAVAIDAGKAEYHLWSGNAYGVEAQRANPFRQALLARRVKAAFERAVALDPTLVDARYSLLQFYLRAPGFMGGSIAKAKEQGNALLGLHPVLGRLGLASIALKEDDLVGAERELVALVREQPDSIRGIQALGNFYADHARPAEAFRVFDQWVAKHPTDLRGLHGIGRTAAVTGQQLDRGAAALRQALALPAGADDASAIGRETLYFRLGMIHEKAGRAAEARTAYEAALKLDPDHTGAREGRQRVS